MRDYMQYIALAFVITVALFGIIGTVMFALDTGPIGLSAADSHGENSSVSISAERQTNGNVSIAVSASAFDSDVENASIDVAFDNFDREKTLNATGKQAGDYVFETSVEDFVGDAQVTKKKPSITVSNRNWSNSTEVDVRLLKFGSRKNLSVDNGTYNLPVEQVIGHSNNKKVPLRVSGSGQTAPFEGEFKCEEDCRSGKITVDPADFQSTVSPLIEQEYVAYPEQPHLSTSQRFDLSSVDALRSTLSDDGLELVHPLLFEGSDYVIIVKTEDPSGKYIVERTATETGEVGQVAVSSLITRAGSSDVTVTDARRNQHVVSTASLELGPETHTVMYDPANGSVDFSGARASLPDSVDTVWVNDSGEIRRVENVSVNRTRLKMPIGNVSPPFQLLVVGNETTLRATVSQYEQTPKGQQNQSGLGLSQSGDGGRYSKILTTVGYLLVMGILGGVSIPLFGLIGRKARSVLNVAATALGVAIILSGVVAFRRFVSEWYGIHLYVVAAVVAVGLTTGALKTFNQDQWKSDIINFGLSVAVLFVATVAFEYLFTSISWAGFGSAFGATLGTIGGFFIAARHIDPKHPVTIKLVDEETDDLVTKTAHVNIKKIDGKASTTVKLSEGTATTEISEGEWRFSSGTENITKRQERRIRDEELVTLPVKRRNATIRVTNSVGDPLRNATVTVIPESDSGRRVELRHTNEGVYEGDLPAGFSTVTVRVDCDRYQSDTRKRNTDNGLEENLKLEPKQGSLKAAVSLGGDPIKGIDVVAIPDSDVVTSEEPLVRTTDEHGQVVESDTEIGTWTIRVELPSAAEGFDIDPIDNPVTITEDTTTPVQTDIRFSYELPPDVHRRLERLRNRLDSIASHPRSDVAIPSFYASVVHELANTIEQVPNAPALFLHAGESPAATVEALLTAVEAGIDAIDEAMSSKQNVDLFAACGDMKTVDADWGGTFELTELFEIIAEDSSQRRAQMAERLDEVKETINQELRDLSVVRPAQDMWEQTRDLARDTDREELEMAAISLLAMAFLDAIESVFDREPLRKRMTRTVF